jgi:hypothetical protein
MDIFGNLHQASLIRDIDVVKAYCAFNSFPSPKDQLSFYSQRFWCVTLPLVALGMFLLALFLSVQPNIITTHYISVRNSVSLHQPAMLKQHASFRGLSNFVIAHANLTSFSLQQSNSLDDGWYNFQIIFAHFHRSFLLSRSFGALEWLNRPLIGTTTVHQ